MNYLDTITCPPKSTKSIVFDKPVLKIFINNPSLRISINDDTSHFFSGGGNFHVSFINGINKINFTNVSEEQAAYPSIIVEEWGN